MFHLFTKIDSISTSELEAKLKEPIQLLDVRTPMEFRRGHIKNSKNVPLSEIGSYTPATKETLYVICHSGMRSKMAAKKLKKKGYDVINVRGGMSALGQVRSSRYIKEKVNENYHCRRSCRRYVSSNPPQTSHGRR